jgi:UDP-glucose 4-epimerase
MSDYIDKLSRGLQAEFYGSGEKTRDFVYIEDAIDAFERCLEIPLTDGSFRFFNFGTSVETTLMDLYSRIARLLGRRPEPVCLPPRPGELEGYSLDFQRARAVLGWTPKHDLDSGLRETIRWRSTLAP